MFTKFLLFVASVASSPLLNDFRAGWYIVEDRGDREIIVSGPHETEARCEETRKKRFPSVLKGYPETEIHSCRFLKVSPRR